MNWTDKQYKAIYDRDRSILVAAAAGSGKTAVLVERIKQLILNDGCSIDRMLVVTFTDAAASEMKEKIEKAIRDEISKLAADDGREAREKTNLLKKQLDLLPMAQISTFHSFAMEVVRRFFFTIGCEPNFKICDDANKAILQGNAMDRLFEERYASGGEAFTGFLRKFGSVKTDENVREMIDSLSFKLESMPEPIKWLDEMTEELRMGSEDMGDSSVIREIFREAASVVRKSRRIFSENLALADRLGLEAGRSLPESDYASLDEIDAALESGDYDRLKAASWEFGIVNFNKKCFSADANPGISAIELTEAMNYIKERRDYAKQLIYDLRKDILTMSREQMARDISATYEDVLYLGGLVREYDQKYREEKDKKSLMDFSDLEHYAYKILKNDEVANHYRKLFKYVFVDEYQDSNIIQEAIIERIAGERNLFTVGDVKQSIYKFRLAEPEIFKDRYQRYKSEEALKGQESLSEKIDLNQNFRSKDSVVDFVNEIFSEVMEDYGDDEALHAGDPHRGEDNYPPKLYLVDEVWSDDEDIDSSIKELKKTEKEALLTVKLIREYLGKPIFDSKLGRERPLTKRDIVILMRTIKNRGDTFYKVLMENNIPAYVDDNKGFFDTIEINTFISLLEVIDNRKQDLPLLTVMRSEILRFTINELAMIRAAHKEGSFYDSLVAYSGEGGSEELRLKCSSALESISGWQELARVAPLEELVWTLMVETGFYAAMGAMPGGALRQANLRLLADKALDYRKNRSSGLYGFIRYVDHIKKKEIKMGQAKVVSEDEDTVRIMSIHHSKGLEFPMVIIAGYTRDLKGKNTGGNLPVHKDLGIGLPIVDRGNFWYRNTILQALIKRRIASEELDEQKRILYVAMTRAKDILLMAGSAREPALAIDKITKAFPRDGDYFSMTGRLIAGRPGRAVAVSDRELARISRLRKRSIKRAIDILDEETYAPDEETERIMSYSYPFEGELKIKSKYSVSELNRGSFAETPVFDPSVPRLPEETTLSSRHVGTVTHSVLERMDFYGIGRMEPEEGREAIGELLDRMVSDELITAEEAGAVRTDKLYEFAHTPLGRRIGEAQKKGCLYREKPFNLIMEVEGSEAMVQGIIDCYFEEDGRLILVDYKTTAPYNAGSVRERYKVQMDIYRDALQKATGLSVRESYLYLTNLGMTVDMY